VSRSVHVGFVVDELALGQVFVEVLWFLMSVSFHCCSIFTHISSGCWTNGLLQAQFHRDIVLPHCNNNNDNSSRLVTLLKFIYASGQVSVIFVFTVYFKLINFVFQIFPFLFGPVSSIIITSYIVDTISIHLACILQPLQIRCFLLSNNFEHSSSNHGVCCFNS
jgi:hypothetical protein